MTNIFPNLEIEKYYEKKFKGLICGIDEVGRGCLAGPVVAAAIILNYDQIPEEINGTVIWKPGRASSGQGITFDIKN